MAYLVCLSMPPKERKWFTLVNRIANTSSSGLTGELPHFISEKCEIKGTGAVELPIRRAYSSDSLISQAFLPSQAAPTG